ncbi:hypothetical protein LGM54_06170 [Burkholderia cenocepacia]|uniref:hypothetical protein n=1 Tax=Burkholderia cenocepacia TaxID=95486 RepID=UPI001CF4128D|nr:hypothetical protein [Burkholderia cenocepacia]MCA7962538.1 hypothetical protein [Burkholderia cenocepacia]
MKTTDKSRADALTDDKRQALGEALTEFFAELDRDIGIDTPDRILSLIDYHDDRFIDDLIDRVIVPAIATPVEQHEAAPAETCPVCHAKPGQWQCPKSTNDLYNPRPEAACRMQPEPPAADERAAFVKYIGCDRPETEGVAVDAWDYHRKTWLAALAYARASSPNAAGAEGASDHD